MTTRPGAVAVLASTLVAFGCDEVTSTLPEGPPPDVVAITWPRVTPPVSANFYAVAGSGPSDVVIVGSGGTILRWDGMALLQQASGTTEDLHAVSVVSPTRAVAVGNRGTVLVWDGTTWLPPAGSPVTQANLYGVWADEDDAFAVGDRGIAIAAGPMSGNPTWTVVPTSSPDVLYTVNYNGDEVVAFGSLGTVAHFDDGRFTRTSLPGYSKSIVGSERRGSRLNLVGLDGALLNYNSDGTVTPRQGLPAVFLRGVGSAGGASYVAGWDGVLLSVSGGAVTVYANVPERWLYGVYAADVAADMVDVWVVGTSGLVLRGPPRPAPPVARPVDGGFDQ